MDEELRKAIDDYFDANDFAEFIGVTTMDLILAFPDEVENCLDDIIEMMGVKKPEDTKEEE